jgi:hypothetical protein
MGRPVSDLGGPGSGPLARVSVPLTPEHSYEEFLKGLKPIRIGRKTR